MKDVVIRLRDEGKLAFELPPRAKKPKEETLISMCTSVL